MNTYALILNPKSGRGKGRRFEHEIHAELERRVGEVKLFITQYPGHAKEIADQIKNDYSVIIAAGGDGTIHEVVNGMMYGKAALAVIPTGSGNDFVKMLDIPLDYLAAIDIILRDVRMKIDVGKVGEVYFPNGLGIGFDAWVVRESMKIKRLRGFFIYLYSVLKTVFMYRNQKLRIEMNGTTQEKNIFLIAVGNGVAMGGGFFLTPDAVIDDGAFDVCIIRALNKKEIFLNLPKALNGKHVSMKQVEMIRTDALTIRSQEGIAAHADGELMGMNLTELEVTMLPSVLEVVSNSTGAS